MIVCNLQVFPSHAFALDFDESEESCELPHFCMAEKMIRPLNKLIWYSINEEGLDKCFMR